MRQSLITEQDLERFNENMKRIKGTVGGSVNNVGRAIARPSPGVLLPTPPPTYRSKWEAAFASKLGLEKRAGLIKAYKYEGISLQLSKGQYHRPDFLIWHLDGSIEIAQVKGWHKNLRAGTKGLKWAAQLHPWFTWTLKRWTGKGWDSHYVEI